MQCEATRYHKGQKGPQHYFYQEKEEKSMGEWRRVLGISMAAVMTASLALTGCGSGGTEDTSAESQTQGTETAEEGSSAGETTEAAGTEAAGGAEDPEKPEKITIMANGTIPTKVNNRDAFEARWEELTGIDLEIIQPDHDAYYDVMGQTFASGPDNWPDVILMGGTYYTGYANEGALWDMTEAWENSELKASGRLNDESIIEGVKLNGALYGFPVARGNGCITYVKKAWLDNVGMDVPTNYEEYIAMLDAFTNGDPDGNGVNGDTCGVSAAGLIGVEEPYINYLPEFYQDAYPSFTQDENGVWYDGFLEENFRGALERLRDAYNKGYIDKETLTNGTNDCRNKFYENRFGVFTYWAGTWATNLKVNLEANGLDGELVALPPIEEVGTYIERTTPVWAITNACENPEGVFKYFIESMVDGGDMQELWTYGVEDVYWSTKAGEVCGNTYEEGEFHMLESLEKPGTQYTRNHIDPMLAIFDWEGDPGKASIAPEAMESQQTFNDNCRQMLYVPSTEEMGQYNGDLMTLKKTLVANVVVQGMSIDEAYAEFEAGGGVDWSNAIVESLNAYGE